MRVKALASVHKNISRCTKRAHHVCVDFVHLLVVYLFLLCILSTADRPYFTNAVSIPQADNARFGERLPPLLAASIEAIWDG